MWGNSKNIMMLYPGYYKTNIKVLIKVATATPLCSVMTNSNSGLSCTPG